MSEEYFFNPRCQPDQCSAYPSFSWNVVTILLPSRSPEAGDTAGDQRKGRRQREADSEERAQRSCGVVEWDAFPCDFTIKFFKFA